MTDRLKEAAKAVDGLIGGCQYAVALALIDIAESLRTLNAIQSASLDDKVNQEIAIRRGRTNL